MRKTIQSGLVVILTVISVFAMLTYRNNVDPDEFVFIEDQEEETIKPEGTGFIFDDFDKGINIPVEVNKESKAEEKEKVMTSGVEKKRFMRMFEAAMSRLEEDIAFAGLTCEPRVAVEAARDVRGESKVVISKVQNNITMEDKLSLLKIVKNLSINELSSLKKALENGTTDEESIKLWTMLRHKLDEEDYRTLEKIIAKYE